MLAAGLFKYGVAHYEPKEAGECCAISAPRRPAVRFQNTDVPAVDLDEEEPEEEDDDELLGERRGERRAFFRGELEGEAGPRLRLFPPTLDPEFPAPPKRMN